MKINKKLLDKEYSTNFIKEFKFLETKGIYPTFIKDNNGVITYKYTKTYSLFKALEIFYK